MRLPRIGIVAPGHARDLPPGCRRRSASGRVSSPSRRGCSSVSTGVRRSEEHTSELQSLMRISYAVFCLKKKKHFQHNISNHQTCGYAFSILVEETHTGI